MTSTRRDVAWDVARLSCNNLQARFVRTESHSDIGSWTLCAVPATRSTVDIRAGAERTLEEPDYDD